VNILGFVFHNWALKVGALLLAVILYVGMVALQSTQLFTGEVQIQPLDQPPTAVLLKPAPLPSVTNIRYIAAADVPISADSFGASIDLKDALVSPTETSLLKVEVVALDPRIQVIDFQPQEITVQLDPVQTKTVPVVIKPLTVPSGLTMGPQSLSVSQAEVVGPSTLVSQVTKAEARVPIDASGLDVNSDFPLVPVDANDVVVNRVNVNPTTVHVTIQIGSQLRTETVAVGPVLKGSPASGYVVSSIDVTPPVLLVSGEADALAALNGTVSTQPIAISGATGDVSVKVPLNLPNGVLAPDVATVTVVVHLASPPGTRSVQVGVAPSGARPDRVYTLSVPSVTVTIGGATAALNAFDTSTLLGTVSVGNLAPGTYTLAVSVTVPPGIKIVSINPAQVTVVVTVPPSPPPGSPTPRPS
jgi:YbbR domain-containing protein